MTKEIVCPTCEGTGKVMRQIHEKYSEQQRAQARKLFRNGISLRQIGKEIGMKDFHPQKVKSLINAKTL
jgi:hypothetical protein